MAVTGNAVVMFTAEPGRTCATWGCNEPATATVSLPIADEERPLIVITCRTCGVALALDWSEA